jgi:hypothetical protein
MESALPQQLFVRLCMQKADIDHAWRQRQHAPGQVPTEMSDTLSDNAIIDSSITCSCCGEQLVPSQQLHMAVFMAKEADGFCHVCPQMGRKHI